MASRCVMAPLSNANSRQSPRTIQRAGVLVAALLMTAPEAHAGLFDFLFGRHDAPPQISAPPPSVNRFRRPIVSSFRRKARSEAAHMPVKESRSRSVALCCKDGGDPMAAILEDPTLRPGDAVMTERGMTIFEGSGAATRHLPEDLVPLSKASKVSSKDRARVAALVSPVQTPADDTSRSHRASRNTPNAATQKVAKE
jgi:hypothetical protein